MADHADWLADDDQPAAQQFEALRHHFGDIGFREGSAAGEDQALQEGFEAGFRASYPRGVAEGQLLGMLRCCSHAPMPMSRLI
jgi:hypothetical protein